MADMGAEQQNLRGLTPLFLRVDWECKGPESVKAILNTLEVMAQFQLDHPHPGVITYHFSHPDPENRPNFLQFTELYTDVAVFGAHVNEKNVMKAFDNGFNPPDKHKLRSTFYSYGPMLEDSTVTSTCDIFMSKYPGTVTGYLLQESPDFEVEPGDPGAVLLLMELTAKKTRKTSGLFNAEGNVEKVTQVFKDLIYTESNKAISFHVTRPDPKTHPNVFEVFATYSSNSKLVAHLGTEEAQEALKCLVKLSERIKCPVYGKPGELVNRVFDQAGLPYKAAATDVGYVLHPQAQEVFQ